MERRGHGEKDCSTNIAEVVRACEEGGHHPSVLLLPAQEQRQKKNFRSDQDELA